jgi:hypothetical protein
MKKGACERPSSLVLLCERRDDAREGVGAKAVE